VQALPSLQAVPFAAGGLLQKPVAGSQVPPTWHWSVASQGMLPPAVQVPDWQVDAQPAPQGVPFALAGLEQAPFAGLQTASWH
jgi:hypothetical protein